MSDIQKEDLQCVNAGNFAHEGCGEARVLIRADAAIHMASPFRFASARDGRARRRFAMRKFRIRVRGGRI